MAGILKIIELTYFADKKLKDEKRIKYFVIGKLPTSPNIKYEKYGFKKTDESWIQ